MSKSFLYLKLSLSAVVTKLRCVVLQPRAPTGQSAMMEVGHFVGFYSALLIRFSR